MHMIATQGSHVGSLAAAAVGKVSQNRLRLAAIAQQLGHILPHFVQDAFSTVAAYCIRVLRRQFAEN